MNVPEAWREKMMASRESAAVLQNVIDDDSVPDVVADAFCEGLNERGSFEDSGSAWNAAREIVEANPDTFFCQGKSIPAGQFERVVRFMDPEKWMHLLDETKEQEFRTNGYDAEACNTPERATLFCEKLQETPLKIGKPRTIAWVTDSDALPWNKGSCRAVVGRLGLPDIEELDIALLLLYLREDIPKDADGKDLRIPRALDSINCPQFVLQRDPEADTGMTYPVKPDIYGSEGYPEAIHRSDILAVQSVQCRRLSDAL